MPNSTCCRMIKLTSGVETVLECIYSDFMLRGLTVSSPHVGVLVLKALSLSTSHAGCLPLIAGINLFWICISRGSRGSVAYSLVLMA